jgi:hypothetical protein
MTKQSEPQPRCLLMKSTIPANVKTVKTIMSLESQSRKRVQGDFRGGGDKLHPKLLGNPSWMMGMSVPCLGTGASGLSDGDSPRYARPLASCEISEWRKLPKQKLWRKKEGKWLVWPSNRPPTSLSLESRKAGLGFSC